MYLLRHVAMLLNGRYICVKENELSGDGRHIIIIIVYIIQLLYYILFYSVMYNI